MYQQKQRGHNVEKERGRFSFVTIEKLLFVQEKGLKEAEEAGM